MKFNDIIDKIILDLGKSTPKIKLDLIYAFNGTGKTRISRYLVEENENKYLCFNSLFQDDFVWDNENFILNIRKNSWIVDIINEQGLQNEIIDNFHNIYNDSIEPIFNDESNKVFFNAKTENGYDEYIKISKAEETVFIWSVFYTFLDFAISELKEENENRSTNIFDNLEMVIIDDPVSSVDDAIILKLAISVSELIEKCVLEEKNILSKFLITTHHALFYNSLYNLINRNKNIKNESYVFSREKYSYKLETKGDTTFGYHLSLINKIKNAIENNSVGKNHFNMFRILLEKTANYFGYKKYDDCLPEKDYKKEIIRLVNLYSHGNLPEFEYSDLTEEEKKIFINAFNDFKKRYGLEVEVNE